jgi:hypothetical protein
VRLEVRSKNNDNSEQSVIISLLSETRDQDAVSQHNNYEMRPRKETPSFNTMDKALPSHRIFERETGCDIALIQQRII